MFKLTALGDEISSDIVRQMELLESQGIKHLEFRGAKGESIVSLRRIQIRSIKRRLEARGFGVSAIASPIGKSRIDGDFEQQVEQFRRAQHAAALFRAKYIRIFSFYPDLGGNLLNRREEVIERIGTLTEMAQTRGQVLLLENGKRVYGESPERCLDILSTINSPHLRATFDFGNYVEVGVRPFDEAYPLLKDYIDYVHVKDARRQPDGQFRLVPAGEGDGQIVEVLAELAKQDRDIFLSIEPRGVLADTTGAVPQQRLWSQAVQALKRILDQISVTSAVTQP